MANPLRLATESIAGQRPYQEDSVIAETLSDGRTLIAVADGMGGHAAGEVASALALEALVEAVEGGLALGDAFRVANERVHARATEPGKQGMGTTLVAALLDGDSFRVANVGDSRAYLVHPDGIRQLTDDHSFVAEAVRRGRSESEAMATPWRDALTRSVGTDGDLQVDEFGPFPLEPSTALLICSDGLYKTLGDPDLRVLFERSRSAEGAARSLVSAAYDGGSDDNISVAIVEIGEVRAGEDPVVAAPVDDTVAGMGPVDDTMVGVAPADDGAVGVGASDDTVVGIETIERAALPAEPVDDAAMRIGTIAAVVVITLMLLSVLIFGS